MARPKNQFPIPFLRFKDGCWRICWRDGSDRYEFSTGEREESSAESARLQVALSLRGASDWPAWAESIPTIQRWRTRGAIAGAQIAPDSTAALEAWRNHYAASARPQQVADRMDHLRVLSKTHDMLTLSPHDAATFFRHLEKNAPCRYFANRIAAVIQARSLTRKEIIIALEVAGESFTKEQLSVTLHNREVFEFIPFSVKSNRGKYRARENATGLAPRTRNKYLITFNMFYKWAMDHSLVKENPFRGIKSARVEAHAEIIWLTRDERDAITRASESVAGRLPIWIALYAGLRLGEIARLRWEDIDLRQRWIHVKKSKTGKTRRVPISEALLSALHRGEKPTGFVCPHWQDGDYHVKADSDLLTVRKSLSGIADKIKWNVFRHTFASLLAQTGKVSIDQISALMGNTPEVCRRHYAHLIPDAVERTGIDLID